MEKKSTNEHSGKMDAGQKMMVGAGVAALAAAAAGAFFLYGTDAGKKKRKEIKSWALKAKGDVLERMENLKEINEEIYTKVVNEVAEKYKAVKGIDSAELMALVSQLHGQWKNIKKSLNASPKKGAAKKPKSGSAKK